MWKTRAVSGQGLLTYNLEPECHAWWPPMLLQLRNGAAGASSGTCHSEGSASFSSLTALWSQVLSSKVVLLLILETGSANAGHRSLMLIGCWLVSCCMLIGSLLNVDWVLAECWLVVDCFLLLFTVFLLFSFFFGLWPLQSGCLGLALKPLGNKHFWTFCFSAQFLALKERPYRITLDSPATVNRQ